MDRATLPHVTLYTELDADSDQRATIGRESTEEKELYRHRLTYVQLISRGCAYGYRRDWCVSIRDGGLAI